MIVHDGSLTGREREREREREAKLFFTSGVDGGSEVQAYQLSQQHSWHLEDLACSQTLAALHPSIHPNNGDKQ